MTMTATMITMTMMTGMTTDGEKAQGQGPAGHLLRYTYLPLTSNEGIMRLR